LLPGHWLQRTALEVLFQFGDVRYHIIVHLFDKSIITIPTDQSQLTQVYLYTFFLFNGRPYFLLDAEI
jgi:hypothetical protein